MLQKEGGLKWENGEWIYDAKGRIAREKKGRLGVRRVTFNTYATGGVAIFRSGMGQGEKLADRQFLALQNMAFSCLLIELKLFSHAGDGKNQEIP